MQQKNRRKNLPPLKNGTKELDFSSFLVIITAGQVKRIKNLPINGK